MEKLAPSPAQVGVLPDSPLCQHCCGHTPEPFLHL